MGKSKGRSTSRAAWRSFGALPQYLRDELRKSYTIPHVAEMVELVYEQGKADWPCPCPLNPTECPDCFREAAGRLADELLSRSTEQEVDDSEELAAVAASYHDCDEHGYSPWERGSLDPCSCGRCDACIARVEFTRYTLGLDEPWEEEPNAPSKKEEPVPPPWMDEVPPF